jgi:hypothetical protein
VAERFRWTAVARAHLEFLQQVVRFHTSTVTNTLR